MSAGPRLRFAPSPTGSLHPGNARTALVNWLVARQGGGTLVLRIEDTDLERGRPGSERGLLEDLRWLGIDWDEGPEVGGDRGPYRQSARLARHREVVEELLEQDVAFACFCDPERLRRQRLEARERGEGWRYPGTCAAIPAAEARSRIDGGEAAAIRFRAPDRPVRFRDGLRGDTGVGAGEVGDFVIARADGRPTYQLAVVVDDHDMGIDHVIRGQDHLSNTPRQLLLYEALGWRPPAFTHLPLVLAPDRTRLSKREGARSIAEMRAEGLVSEAVVNYLALLGWAPPDDEEVLDPAALLESWRLQALSAANVALDPDKLAWLGQQHLGRLRPVDLRRRATPFLERHGHEVPADGPAAAWWEELLDLARSGVARLGELPRRLGPVFPDGDPPAPELVAELADSVELLEAFREASVRGQLDDEASFREAARGVGRRVGVRGRRLYHPLRLAVTGSDSGPELARLVPLIERGAELAIEPPVTGIAARLDRVLAQLR